MDTPNDSDELIKAIDDASALAGTDVPGALGMGHLDPIETEFWLKPPNQAADLAALAASAPAQPGLQPNAAGQAITPDAISGAGAAVPSDNLGRASAGPGLGVGQVLAVPPPLPSVGTSPSGILPPEAQAQLAAAHAAAGGAPGAAGPATPQAPGAAAGPGLGSIAKAPGVGDIKGANAQVDALQRQAQVSEFAKVGADFAAQQAAANRQADVAQQTLSEMDKANAEYVKARMVNENLADRETHAWMEKWDSAIKAQPDPGHYWHGEGGGLRRALWFGAIAAQALANNRHPERANTMLQMMRQEIDADIQRQKEAIAAGREGLKITKGLMEDRQARRSKDMMEDRDMRLARVQSLGKYLEARAKAPGPEDLKAAYAAVAAHTDQEAAKLAVDYRKESLDSYNKDLDRKHQDRLEGIKQWNENRRQQLGFGHTTSERQAKEQFDTNERLAKEAFEAGMKPVTAKNEAMAKRQAEQTELDPAATGLSIYNRKTGTTRNIVVDKEQQAKAMAEATAASNQYKDLQTLAKAAGNDSELTRLLQTDPEARAAAIKIAARYTREDFSRTTEVEFEKELQAGGGDFAAGSRGRELMTWLSGNKDKVRDFVQKQARDYQADVGRQIVGKYNVGEHLSPDETVQFSPRDVEGQTPHTPTTDEALTRAGVKVPGLQEPETVQDYEDRKEAGKLPPVSDRAAAAIDDMVNLMGWHADTKNKAGLTSNLVMSTYQNASMNVALGKPATQGGEVVPEADREAVLKRMELETERATADAKKAEADLVLNVNNLNDHNFWKAAERKGFNIESEAVHKALEDLHEAMKDPDFRNRVADGRITGKY